jgi:hypothetical protein
VTRDFTKLSNEELTQAILDCEQRVLRTQRHSDALEASQTRLPEKRISNWLLQSNAKIILQNLDEIAAMLEELRARKGKDV